MEDKILKYIEFIKEELNSTPETYMRGKLGVIKAELERLIPLNNDDAEEKDEIEKISVRQAREQNEKKLTLKDLNVRQESSEMGKGHSSIVESLTFKFSDADSAYTIYISTEVKDATTSSSDEDITKFNVEFKKYILSTMEICGSPIGKNVEITSDNNKLKISVVKKAEGQPAPEGQAQETGEGKSLEDFIVDLKLEIDKKYGSDQEELSYETE